MFIRHLVLRYQMSQNPNFIHMSSIDSLLFDSVRELGMYAFEFGFWTCSYIPDDVTSVESMDRVFFFNLCVQCLSLLDESILEFVHFIVDEEDLNHSICCDLADGFAVVLFLEIDCSELDTQQRLGLATLCIPNLKILLGFSCGWHLQSLLLMNKNA